MPQITIDISDEMMAFLQETADRLGESPEVVLGHWATYPKPLADIQNVSNIHSHVLSISGFLAALLANDFVFTEEDKQEFYKIMHQECEQIKYVLDRYSPLIMNINHYAEESYEMIHIRSLISKVVEIMEGNTYKKTNHHVLWELDSSVPQFFYADKDRLEQVFFSLIGNAMKFSPSGGQIKIKGRISDDEKNVEFSVQDEGVGMGAEFVPRIGERFLRESREIGGTGIGLSIVKRLLEAYQGQLWAYSEGKGKGSTFFFTLSLAHGCDYLVPRMFSQAQTWTTFVEEYKETLERLQGVLKSMQDSGDSPEPKMWEEAKLAVDTIGRKAVAFGYHEVVDQLDTLTKTRLKTFRQEL
jgi:hypothetical protein